MNELFTKTTKTNFFVMAFHKVRFVSDMAVDDFMQTIFPRLKKGKVYAYEAFGQNCEMIAFDLSHYSHFLIGMTDKKGVNHYKVVMYDGTKSVKIDRVVLNDWYWGVSVPGFIESRIEKYCGGDTSALVVGKVLTSLYQLALEKPELLLSFFKTTDRPVESYSSKISAGLPTLGKRR